MPRVELDQARLRRLTETGAVALTTPAVFEVTGSGALTCLQGLLTNDLAGPGERSLVYGALLTPKGAIVVDYWVLRLAERFLLVAEPAGHGASLDLFRRSLPPRLARVADRTGVVHALWLLGPAAAATLAAAGLPFPEPGRVAETGELLIARGAPGAPFTALLLGESVPLESAMARLTGAGLAAGDQLDREAARILAGWPRLGAEIGERTLVQEVRFDEIGGVSYTKGCYIGQETVARLHFRGHTNRELRGLIWAGGEPSGDEVTDTEGKELGTVTSVLALPGRTVGLGLIRREVAPESAVLAGGVAATVVKLPFGVEAWGAGS